MENSFVLIVLLFAAFATGGLTLDRARTRDVHARHVGIKKSCPFHSIPFPDNLPPQVQSAMRS